MKLQISTIFNLSLKFVGKKSLKFVGEILGGKKVY